MIDPESGVETWHYDLPQRGTLTGELPQLLGEARSLFVLVPRNYGMAIQRIDPVNGHSLWQEERRLTHATLTADQVTFDHRAIYYAAGNVVHAQNLADGQALWSLPMPMAKESWRLLLIGDSLLAAPNLTAESHPSKRDFIEWPAILSQGPVASPHEQPAHFLVTIDPQNGQLMQRLNLFVDAPARTARKLLKQHTALTFFLSKGGLTVGVPGRVCRFDQSAAVGN
jgi:hypothetical protein